MDLLGEELAHTRRMTERLQNFGVKNISYRKLYPGFMLDVF
jgi:hypothetical protein